MQQKWNIIIEKIWNLDEVPLPNGLKSSDLIDDAQQPQNNEKYSQLAI